MIDDERLKKLNVVMETNAFLGDDPSCRHFWHMLITEIWQLAGGPDRCVIPDPNEPYAWRKAWKLYERFRDRARLGFRSPCRARPRAQVERLSEQPHGMLAQAHHGGLTENAAQFCGLKPGDLGEPVLPPDSNRKWDSRREGWQAIAGRLEDALQRWKGLSPESKRQIPIIMAARRAEAALAEMKARFEAIEARLAEIESTAVLRRNGRFIKNNAA